LRTDARGRHTNIRSTFILTLTAVIWGMAFVAQRVSMEFIGPFLFMGIRMLFGALTLLVVLLVSGLLASARKRGQKRGEDLDDARGQRQNKNLTGDQARSTLAWSPLLKAGIACGSVVFLAGCFQQAGLVFTTASKAGFLTTLYIVLVPILGIALKHKTHWNTWISVLIAVVGLYFLCVTGGFSIQLGDMLTLIGALFWACHILVIDHFVEGLTRRDVMKLCTMQFAVASVLSLAAAPIFDGLFVVGTFSWESLAAALPTVLYVGVLSTGVAFTLQAFGQQGLNPSAASIIMSLEAVFSVIGGMLILGEVLSGRELFGCIAMFSAVLLSQLPVGTLRYSPADSDSRGSGGGSGRA
jgi:drug/metabolite transporter (DMT)-like permease